jgi:microcystin-dependent protein
MSQPFIGEIRMFGGNFAPAGWAFCDGQLMAISQNDALFTLIGTTFGGDGQETFALPDLQSRVPVHMGSAPGGSTYTLGEKAGVESVTLTTQQIPVHNHPLMAQTNAGNQSSPVNTICAQSGARQYVVANTNATMTATAISPAGGSQPHENMMPFLVISFIISLFGIFPQQN